jgi:hypothetical protein
VDQGALHGGAWTGAARRIHVEGVFRRTILLPSTVEYAEADETDQIRFGVRDAKCSTPHLDGLVSF